MTLPTNHNTMFPLLQLVIGQ